LLTDVLQVLGVSLHVLLLELLQSVIAPLVHTDGGELYLVRADGDEVVLHLAGTCAGCPGASLTIQGVIEPTLRTILPSLRLQVSAGFSVPAGAQRIEEKNTA